MKCVYILQGLSHPNQRYVGLTANLDDRLKAHNAGRTPHTSQFRPWEIKAAISLDDDAKALAFERYLKTGSGRAFSFRHLL